MPVPTLMPHLTALQQTLTALRDCVPPDCRARAEQAIEDLCALESDLQAGSCATAPDRYRHDALFNNHHSVMLLIEPSSGEIVDANPAACAYYGYTHAELTAKRITDLNVLPPAEVQAEMQRACQVQQNFFTFKHRLANGEVREVEVHSGAITLDERPLLYSIIHDITVRRRAEEALQLSEANYRRLFNSAQVGIFRSAIADGRMMEANSRLAEMFGYDSPAEMQDVFLSTTHYLDPTDRARILAELKDDGTYATFEVPFTRRNGSVVWVLMEVHKDPLARCLEGVMLDITAHHQVADALIESEMRNSSIVDALSEGVLLLQRNGEILFANASAERLLGLPLNQILGHSVLDPRLPFIQPDGSRFALDTRPAIMTLRTGQPLREVIMGMQRTDGTLAWMSVNSEPMIEPDSGEPYAVVISFTDVTDRVQAEAHQRQINEELEQRVIKRTAELQESEARYRDLIENTVDWIWQIDQDDRYVYASPQVRELLGYEPHEIIGRTPFDLMPPDEAQRLLPLFAEVKQRRQQFAGLENRCMQRDGHEVVLETSARPVIGSRGEFLGYRGIDRDVTARRSAEEARRASEERLRLILEATRDGFWDWDMAANNVIVSPSLIEMLGYTPAEFDANVNFWPQLVHPDDWAEVKAASEAHFAGHTAVLDIEHRMRAKSGEWWWSHTRGQVVARAAAGQPLRFVGTLTDITDRKRAEEALRESEARYRGLIESQNDLIVRVDQAGHFTYVNDAYCRTFGKTREELLSSTFMPLVHPDDLAATLKSMEGLNTPPYRVQLEQRAHAVDGWRWFAWEDFAIRNEHGTLIEIQAVGRDITDRKRAEEALRESESLYHALVETLPMNIFRKDQAGRFIFVNSLFCLTMNRPSAELIGQTDMDLHPAELAQKYRTDDEQVMASGRSLEVIETHQSLGGQPIYVQTIKTPLYDLGGQPTGIQGVFWDITQQKQAEDALRQSEAHNRAILNALPDLMFRVSRDGIYLEFQGKPTAELLASPEVFLGHPLQELLPPALAQIFLQTIAQVLESGNLHVFEYQLDIAGQAHDFEARVVPSGAAEALAIVRSITDRKQAEAALQQALSRERELNLLKTQFVSMVSHEFRTPLTAIQSTSDLLRHYSQRFSEEKKQRYLERIQTAIGRMTTMLDEVLVLGRAESGKLEFNPAPIDLPWFCGALVDELQLNAGDAYTLSFTLDGDCQGARLDESLLRHILTNLLSNAIKYSPNGGPVDFAARCHDNHVTFRVADCGIGIPPEAQAQLFQTFYRADNVGSIQGTGLGLAIVKHAVDLHGGTIMFDSAPGCGTTFVVTLPLINA